MSIDASTADPPSTTTPSTGTRSPGRTRSRSPTATASSGTSWSRAVTDDARRRGAEPDQPVDRAGRPPLRARLEPAPEQDEADDDRRRVEVGDGLDAGRLDDRRPQGDHHAVGPGGGRADRHERVHVRRPVAGRSPRRAVEAAAGPELDERGRDRGRAGSARSSRSRSAGTNITTMIPSGDHDRDRRARMSRPCASRARSTSSVGQLVGEGRPARRRRSAARCAERRSRPPRSAPTSAARSATSGW